MGQTMGAPKTMSQRNLYSMSCIMNAVYGRGGCFVQDCRGAQGEKEVDNMCACMELMADGEDCRGIRCERMIPASRRRGRMDNAANR